MDLTIYSPELLALYQEEGELILPLDLVDGYGKIEALETQWKEMEQVEWQTRHHFSDGVYTRESYVPAGTVLTGYRHKQETVSIVTQGAISVVTIDQTGRAERKGILKAPDIIVTKPGIKKVGYTHEDTIFVNCFPLSDIPLDKRSEEFIDLIEETIFYKDV